MPPLGPSYGIATTKTSSQFILPIHMHHQNTYPIRYFHSQNYFNLSVPTTTSPFQEIQNKSLSDPYWKYDMID